MIKNLQNKKQYINLIASFMLILSLFCFVGCSSSSKSNSSEESGMITGSLLDAANSNIVASGETGEYLIPVDSFGRFSASIPVGVYTLSYRSSSTNKLVLTNKSIIITNNVTINVLDADLIPQPKILAISVPVVNSNSAIIEWETDIESDGYVEYGTDEHYGISTYVSTDLSTQHRVQISSLLSNTTYHFRVIATRHNLESVKFISQDYSFTTTELR